MGMTDRQFDAYLQSLLRDLKRVEEEVAALSVSAKSKSLDLLISDIEGQLKKP